MNVDFYKAQLETKVKVLTLELEETQSILAKFEQTEAPKKNKTKKKVKEDAEKLMASDDDSDGVDMDSSDDDSNHLNGNGLDTSDEDSESDEDEDTKEFNTKVGKSKKVTHSDLKELLHKIVQKKGNSGFKSADKILSEVTGKTKPAIKDVKETQLLVVMTKLSKLL